MSRRPHRPVASKHLPVADRHHVAHMSEEIDLAAKTTGEVVAALADETGALAVPREYANYIAARVHLRHLPRLAESAMAVAEKIRASGLPRRAFPELDEPLVTAILEGMAEETNPGIQAMWENLLATMLTETGHPPQRAFPQILRALDPSEARCIDHCFRDRYRDLRPEDVKREHGLRDANLDNLERLGVIRFELSSAPVWKERADLSQGERQWLTFTRLARDLWRACSPPLAD
jgi:hypothetical protein